ncbi:hypothetical protein ACMU_07140 [Actibacterium mucosum KCTC 23349]|uniref:Uncharacterized protein n=1 Tax=Actibacterium mucosum KCTC 23349 TaxID=1454373 RepID=A0A037ZKS7_9RHOB|nr:hypothetical protein ACMU_07140 [Actibacterium mucosum KCTC 23349]
MRIGQQAFIAGAVIADLQRSDIKRGVLGPLPGFLDLLQPRAVGAAQVGSVDLDARRRLRHSWRSDRYG